MGLPWSRRGVSDAQVWKFKKWTESPWGCLGVAVESPWGFRRTGVEIEHFRILQNGTFTKIWNRLELDMNLPWDRLGVALGCLSQHRAYNSGLGR